MSTSTEINRPPKAKNTGKLFFLISSLLIFAAAVYLFPAFLQQKVNSANGLSIYYMGTLYQTKAIYRGEEPYLPLDFLQEVIDPKIVYDDKNRLIIIANSRDVYHLPVDKPEGLLNLEPFSFTYPVIQVEGTTYLPADPLSNYYGLEINDDKEGSALRIYNRQQAIPQGKILSNTRSRSKASLRSPWIANFAPEETVYLLREEKGWYWAEADDGRLGYLPKSKVSPIAAKTWPQLGQNTYQTWKPLGEPLILTWEVAGNTTVNPKELGALTGVNVFSPTWFHLRPEGIVVNKADSGYVRWAHRRGGQVWGLFDNNFDPEQTHNFLNDTSLRIKAIKQLLSYAELYQLDGINVDFENMYLADKAAYVQFIRELAPLLHARGRTLTVDVTFHSMSENWSLCYDRKALAEAADYLAVMAYDENGVGSKEAGSVASLPWVEQGVQRMLEEVPPDKILLGVPFFTRLWTEEAASNGQIKVTSKALSMDKAREWLQEEQAEIVADESTGQHYAAVKEGSITKRMWLEDNYSLEQRIEVLKKYKLAGLAAWRRGFEAADTWQFISDLAKK